MYMGKGSKMMDHIKQMILINKELSAIDSSKPGKLQVSTILNSQQPLWDLVIIAISCTKKTISIEELHVILALEKERKNRRNCPIWSLFQRMTKTSRNETMKREDEILTERNEETKIQQGSYMLQ